MSLPSPVAAGEGLGEGANAIITLASGGAARID